MMQWVKIFADETSALARIKPDTPQLVVIGSLRICLVLHDETFRAVQDSCSHNGESLSKGSINYLGEIICPWHHYCFNLETGRELSARSADLKTYPLKVDDSGFFIGI